MAIELSEEQKIKHREKKMAVAVLYEAKVKDDEIIRILQKFCDIDNGEAMDILRNEKIIEAPSRKLTQFLLLEKGFSADDTDRFIHKYVKRKLASNTELCKLPPEKLYNEIQKNIEQK
ncbi:MAG: hypothetical protein HDR05_07350 [Lachnospiraceae bacterium]|nr:hypothetical protein [Lachnospiraceae bacterium]